MADREDGIEVIRDRSVQDSERDPAPRTYTERMLRSAAQTPRELPAVWAFRTRGGRRAA